MAPIPAGQAASERMSQSRFVPLPGIGHFPFLECPDKCAELIFDFLGA